MENLSEDPDSPSSKPAGMSETPGEPDRASVANLLAGRGRLGKTVVANAIVQFCRAHGAEVEAWNADRQNQTHSLSIFHPDARRPPSDDPEDKRLWLEGAFDEQGRRRFDTVIDMAGGDPLISHLAKGARLIQTMKRRGVRVVSMQVLGTEAADLDYLRASVESGLFVPEATLLILNSGLVRSGRSVEAAFAEVLASKVVEEAMSLGAEVAWFPALLCMSAVTDRGLSFQDAMRGLTKPGQEPLSFFDQSRVEIFWEDDLPRFFASIPADWLPAMPNWRR